MTDEPRLVDGSVPATPEDLFARLEELGIETRTVEHPPVFTVEESQQLRGQLPGGHCKNLFLRDKKGHMWLVVCAEETAVDLKALGKRLGGRLSFGSARRLMENLGVIPGAVTPFAIVNDRAGAVRVVIERQLAELPLLNFHPLDNARTTAIATTDLLRLLEAENHAPELLELPTR